MKAIRSFQDWGDACVLECGQHPTQARGRNNIWKLILQLLIRCFKLLKPAAAAALLAVPGAERTPSKATAL